MGYLKQAHSRVLLISAVIFSVSLFLFSRIDIEISKLFFLKGFYLKDSWWVTGLYKSVGPFIIVSILMLVCVWLFNLFKKKNILAINNKKIVFLMLVLIIGSGLIVNVVFKEGFGRARPRDVVEFNGTHQFTPAFIICEQCEHNCSFSSGHGAGAFFALALALLFKRRKRALAIAFLYGAAVSLARIVAGGHFFSDNLVSFFVMAITTDVLYYLMFRRTAGIKAERCAV